MKSKNLAKYGLEVPLVIRMTANKYNLKVNDLFRNTRQAHVAEARQYVMYLLQTKYGFTQKQAGEIFGKDHATASHAKGVIETRIKLNQLLCDLNPLPKYRLRKAIKVTHINNKKILYCYTFREVTEKTELTEWDIKRWYRQKHKPIKGYFLQRIMKEEKLRTFRQQVKYIERE